MVKTGHCFGHDQAEADVSIRLYLNMIHVVFVSFKSSLCVHDATPYLYSKVTPFTVLLAHVQTTTALYQPTCVC